MSTAVALSTTSDSQLNPELREYLEARVASTNLEQTPYFKALLSGEFSKEDFLKTQIEFSHLVKFFNRPMALMISNIPHAERRVAIVDNLWEEHGRGVTEKIHGTTILTLIDRLGGDSSAIDDSTLSENVRAFNQALRGAAAFEDYRFSAAMFGAIERTFVDVSSLMCKAIVEHDWLPLDRITHYGLHKEIDIKHAEDFLMVADQDWDHPAHKQSIKDGIAFGAHLFASTYTGYYYNVKQSG